MRTKKTFCFYSTGIECDWEWIRSSIGKIGVYSPGLFLHTPERFQFSETGVPGIWFHFILLTKRPKPVCLPAEKCKPDHRLSLMLCQEGACTCVVNTERCIPFCIPLMHTVEHEDREREKVTEWDWQRKGEMGQGCHDMWLRHPRMHAQVHKYHMPAVAASLWRCKMALLWLRDQRCWSVIKIPLPIIISSGGCLFSFMPPCLGKGLIQKRSGLCRE